MSTVNGFQVGANVLKYSAEALENYNTPDYSSSSTYAVGNYVMYQGKLYKCKTAITTAEAWTAAHWETAILSNDVSDLKSAIENTFGNDLGYIYPVWEQGMLSTDGEHATDKQIRTADYIPISDVYGLFLSAPSAYNFGLYFYDSSNNYVTRYLGRNGSYSWLRDGPRAAKVRFVISYTDDTIAIKPKEGINLKIQLKNDTDSLVENVFDEWDYSKRIALQKVIGVKRFPNNLVDPVACRNNHYINYGSGTESTNNTGYFCTWYIPVTAGNTYRANKGRNHAFYDSSYVYLSGASGDGIQAGITAPVNASYIRFTVNKSTDGITNPYDLYFADVNNYDDLVEIDGLTVDVAPWCYGKKINWMGDSIVAGSDFDEYITSTLGMLETDYGIDGSTIALKADGTDGRNACCARYSSMSNDADIIAVSCGTNDFEYAWCPIGTINDADDGTSNNTFYGALKALCKGLIDKYPKKLIFFTTPIKRAQAFADGNGGTYTADGVMTTPFSKNKYGNTLMDYADIIKEVCGYYSIPVLDLNRESLLNPHLTSQQDMFDSVYTHPNADGQKIMARRVCGWLMQLGYTID